MAVVQYKTPGVYVEELDAFPPSIVGVETAVPVFIGYTEKAEQKGRSLKLRPTRISSMVDYRPIFGKAYNAQFTFTQTVITKADVDEANKRATAAEAVRDKADGALKALPAPANPAPSPPAVDPNKRAHDQANDALVAATTVATQARTYADTLKTEYGKTDAGAKDLLAVPLEEAFAKLKETDSGYADAKAAATKARQDVLDAEAAAMRAAGPPDLKVGGKGYSLTPDKSLYLYNSLRLFYANGGGDCYIVSVGSYADGEKGVLLADLQAGLDAAHDLVGPTMLVIPEAVKLGTKSDYDTLVAAMLRQCFERQDRVAILDMWGIDQLAPNFTQADLTQKTTDFRKKMSGLPSQHLKYGMAYAPFLRTSIVDPTEVSFLNFHSRRPDEVQAALEREINQLYPDPAPSTPANGVPVPWLSAKGRELQAFYLNQLTDIGAMPPGDEQDRKFVQLNQSLAAQVPIFKDIYALMATKLGTLPPSAAMAGVYTQNDLLRGVWNAPANVGLVSVIAPTVRFSDTMQHDLNMPIDGFAINAIRDFVGRGTLVWGARTLDGNSNDWRYIQVRRALIYIEQSVELALNKFVFAPNVAQTWVTVTSMVGSFLRGVWQAGGLMGASPAEAFSVQCGLGSTMTAQDVLEGRMIVQIKLTMVHPAEFIVLTFQQQMQGGA
jgi:phage tail sheath protein FI